MIAPTAMPTGLLIMQGVAAVAALAGLPMLFAPAGVRRLFGWGTTPQSVYILRVAGMMAVALAAILCTFATVYWRSTRGAG